MVTATISGCYKLKIYYVLSMSPSDTKKIVYKITTFNATDFYIVRCFFVVVLLKKNIFFINLLT